MVLMYASHLADQGHEVSIEANKIDTVFNVNPKILTIPIGPKGQLGTMLSAFFKKRHADVVIADIIPLAFALYIRNRKRVLYFAQDYNVTHYTNTVMKSLVKILDFIGLRLLKIRTITVSEELSLVLSSQFRANIVQVIPNGVDMSLFHSEPSPVLRAEKQGQKSILVLSRKDPRKGFDVAQQVIKKVKAICPVPFEVWTVGEPSKGTFPGIAHRDFGYVPELKMRDLFSSADLFLNPSYSEGFGLMVIEAFACKCPVVTTDAISYAIHGKNAMVSRVGDIDSMAINVRRLLESSDTAQAIIANGFTCAQKYSLEHALAAFEKTLTSLSREQRLC